LIGRVLACYRRPMKRCAFVLVLWSAACSSSTPPPEVEPAEPAKAADVPGAKVAAPANKTKRDATQEELFGVNVEDPYRWLEDEKAPDVKVWMAERDEAARAHLAKLTGRDAIAGELKDLLYVDWRSAPAKRGKRFFYTARTKEQEKSIVYWQEGEKGAAKVLLDPNAMSSDGSVSLGAWVPTWDGKTVAYMIKGHNADESTL
jgi:prolyl oligopeptidase